MTAVAQQQQQHIPKVARDILISGIGVSCGTTVTNPIDVIKTRLQLQPTVYGSAKNPGLVKTGVLIVRHEGLLRLWAGWPPAVGRAMVYGGLRLGLYTPMKELVVRLRQPYCSPISAANTAERSQLTPQQQQQGTGAVEAANVQVVQSTGSAANTWSSLQARGSRNNCMNGSSNTLCNSHSSSTVSSSSSGNSSSRGSPESSVSVKLLAGTASGALAAALLSPTELVKVRLQQANSPYKTARQVVAGVIKEDGIKGLWKGTAPGVVRAAALTASQCATYDEVKTWVMDATHWPDNSLTHLATAMITGIVSTTATNPVDVIKTYMFVGGSSHRNPWQCAAAIYDAHGLGGFWRGWLANYARLGPQTVMTFLVVEQLRHMAGMEPL